MITCRHGVPSPCGICSQVPDWVTSQLSSDPRVPGGRYFSGYWHHKYRVDTMFSTVHRAEDGSRWIPGTTFFDVTWIPTEDALHPKASAQWRGDGYRKSRHCTAWDQRHDEIVTQP